MQLQVPEPKKTQHYLHGDGGSKRKRPMMQDCRVKTSLLEAFEIQTQTCKCLSWNRRKTEKRMTEARYNVLSREIKCSHVQKRLRYFYGGLNILESLLQLVAIDQINQKIPSSINHLLIFCRAVITLGSSTARTAAVSWAQPQLVAVNCITGV